MTPVWWTRPLVSGDRGRDVAVVRRKLGLPMSEVFDDTLTLVVRGFQQGLRLPVDGVVDADTAAALGELEGFGLLPQWWEGPIVEGDPGWSRALSLAGVVDAAGLKRFQGNHRLPVTGVVCEATAKVLAAMEVE